jgi:predicted amidohydrolase
MKLTRRQFLKAGVLTGAAALLDRPILLEAARPGKKELCLALCHLEAKPGEIANNRLRVAGAVKIAAREGANWIVTPELCVPGYGFADKIGTDWIQPQPAPWIKAMMKQAKDLKVTLFLSHLERDSSTGRLHNTVFVIGPDGKILGSQRKIRTLKHGSESWSSPGETVKPIDVPPFGRVGVLICADAWKDDIAREFRYRGADILVSSAAWTPGEHGPGDAWERCTRETGIPLVVCNRTGIDTSIDFSESESIVASQGRRLYTFRSKSSAIFFVDWKPDNDILFSVYRPALFI